MSKKDYIQFAEMLKSQKPAAPEDRTAKTWENGARDEWCTVVLATAAIFAQSNPRFDRERFLHACGYVEN